MPKKAVLSMSSTKSMVQGYLFIGLLRASTKQPNAIAIYRDDARVCLWELSLPILARGTCVPYSPLIKARAARREKSK
jgi:hypothetical protein